MALEQVFSMDLLVQHLIQTVMGLHRSQTATIHLRSGSLKTSFQTKPTYKRSVYRSPQSYMLPRVSDRRLPLNLHPKELPPNSVILRNGSAIILFKPASFQSISIMIRPTRSDGGITKVGMVVEQNDFEREHPCLFNKAIMGEGARKGQEAVDLEQELQEYMVG